MHVTVRVALHCLRSQVVAPVVLSALRSASRNRAEFTVVHHSIQTNHIHLLVEARSAEALASGMRSLTARLARRINRRLHRRGAVLSDRWHGVELTSPRQVRNALIYVLRNYAKHSRSRDVCAVDPLSSAATFDGFASAPPGVARASPSSARTWLLCLGWKRHGLIRPDEVPAHR